MQCHCSPGIPLIIIVNASPFNLIISGEKIDSDWWLVSGFRGGSFIRVFGREEGRRRREMRGGKEEVGEGRRRREEGREKGKKGREVDVDACVSMRVCTSVCL